MLNKKLFAAAAVAMLGTSAFAQTTLTAAQCVSAGGTVSGGTCAISPQDLANFLETAGTGTATGGATGAAIGGGISGAAVGVGALVVVAAAAGGGSSGTTTTTN